MESRSLKSIKQDKEFTRYFRILDNIQLLAAILNMTAIFGSHF